MNTRLASNAPASADTVLYSQTVATNQELAPDLVRDSKLNLRIDYVNNMPFVLGAGYFSETPNLASPVPVGEQLLLVDQNEGIYRFEGNSVSEVFNIDDAPVGLTLDNPQLIPNRQPILNIAGNAVGDKVIVVYMSSTLPKEELVEQNSYTLPEALPGETAEGPVPNLYQLSPTYYQVMYEYQFDGEKLSNPKAIASFETQAQHHHGGALEVLPNGDILYATGDGLPFGLDGRYAPQDDNSHLSKILIVDPADGSFEVAAKGVRNVQHFQILDSPQDELNLLVFTDIGGVTAEEINSISLSDLYNTDEIENFGWGRNSVDNLAREGTFYINPGIGLDLKQPIVAARAPSPESGFIQPLAQYGREEADFAAISGPAISSLSFDMITSLFGDLASGEVYATTSSLTDKNVPVYQVNLFDSMLNETSLLELANGRPDPRFFIFPDGTAGVLLEKTGNFYRLTEMITGNEGNNELLGNPVKNTISGLQGNDIINGLEGDDHVFGGKGDDFIIDDRGGNDNLYGGHGNDFIYGGIGDDYLLGEADQDTILGGDGVDFIDGGFGDDLIIGGSGDDTINGNLGNDTVRGGDGRDHFILAPGLGTDEIADFKDGQDFFRLVNVSFDELTITSSPENNATQIQITRTGEVMAILPNVELDTVRVENFI